MNWRDLLFWRRPPVTDMEALADFIDEHAAFLVQKGIFEYSRARAGHYAKVLFSEKEFQDALDRSRWSAYPLGLAMVTELVEGMLRPHAAGAEARLRQRMIALALSVFDRYPVPAQLGRKSGAARAQSWSAGSQASACTRPSAPRTFHCPTPAPIGT